VESNLTLNLNLLLDRYAWLAALVRNKLLITDIIELNISIDPLGCWIRASEAELSLEAHPTDDNVYILTSKGGLIGRLGQERAVSKALAYSSSWPWIRIKPVRRWKDISSGEELIAAIRRLCADYHSVGFVVRVPAGRPGCLAIYPVIDDREERSRWDVGRLSSALPDDSTVIARTMASS